MNDKELADRVVALGVGIKSNRGMSEYSHNLYDFPGNPYPVCDDVFVRDWRVAGALLETCESGSIVNCSDDDLGMWSVMFNGKQAMNDSLARAIIEALS